MKIYFSILLFYNLIFKSLSLLALPENNTDQIILVVPPKYEATDATLYYFLKNGEKWEKYLEVPAYIGLKGLGKEKEGDKKTPVGEYKFNEYFGIEDNPGTNLPYIKVNNSYYWDGDSYSDHYNKLVNYEIYNDFNTSDSEHLIDVDPGYEYAININYNEECTPFKGAGIFLHCFTGRTYTAGCVSIHKDNMVKLYKKLSENCIIVINTEEKLDDFYLNLISTKSFGGNYIKNNKNWILGLLLIIAFI